MINPFIIRKYAGIILPALITTICFFIGLNFYGLLISMGFMVVGLLISLFISSLLLKNPFTDMLEGKGILVFNIDSTGIIVPFIVGVNPPYIQGKINNKPINDVFDRDAVLNLAAPVKNISKTEYEDNKIIIKLDEEEYNKGRFALFHYPVLLWNNQIKTILTKEFLSDAEKNSFAEHGILYLNRKMEELTSSVRDFGRYIVDLTKPKGSLFANKWVWIILIIGLVILAALFAPSIISTIKANMGTMTKTVATAGKSTGGGSVTIR